MLDMKFIRENVARVKKAIDDKNEKVDLNLVLSLDKTKRTLQYEYDTIRAEQNKVSKQISELKKEKKDVKPIIAEMKDIAEKLKNISKRLNEITDQLETELLRIPNIPCEDVPVGLDEEANEFVREWGKPKEYDFDVKDHLELAEMHDLLDIKRAAKVSASGFAGYLGYGAVLERALINFMLDYHIKYHNYTEIMLPVLANRKTMTGTGQLPKLENDMYLIEDDDLFLIPTAEVSVTNYYSGEILSLDKLPAKYVSYSPCFRREAGSYGKETKGLQRLHQFNKVEMVCLVRPEKSYEVLETMLSEAEDILQALGLHYRVQKLATGDLSFASAKTYDLEVWAPGMQKYLEVSSVSNFEDFQSRRASLRFRDESGKVKYLHTLNGSGLATPRTFIALLETYQKRDGSIEIPEVLRPYFPFEKNNSIC